ncbi:hypothetical protein [Pseudoxanthomonas sacheonensis]|uniref:Uncharacterized protein n=1 Tax=Pseudoxanthomonas sacheonensis TaxID=443615 RepID=A0ABU1RTY0_9GAMM|nr:hypothetical protein [Pseudoxanthomonas sacheonensis]MDR6841785.1 hypothetical protein [Pseudoxanthomonas sacheonensis]
MHWLFLLLALGAMGIALKTSSTALMLVCLLASLGLFVAWIMGWYAARVGSNSRDESQMIDPAELRRLREIAEARKAGMQPPVEPPANS